VYEREDAKVADLTRSLPRYLLNNVVRPAIVAGNIPVVLLEEWQTAECTCALADLLAAEGLLDRTVIFWTANNSYGFDRIDWPRLASCANVATISRYMRSIIRSKGVVAQVIPNGIPAELLEAVSRRASPVRAIGRDPSVNLFFKMARWEREKGWAQALGAVAELRRRGRQPLLVARSGGPSATAEGLRDAATERGLHVEDVADEAGLAERLETVSRRRVDVLNLRFPVNTLLARKLFAASDAVLANSIYEPFGLVGLEAMAAGGMIYTGGTGEDYAVDGRNAVVLQTLEPGEIATRWEELNRAPARAIRIRRAARSTARGYRWERIVAVLLDRVAAQAAKQGIHASSFNGGARERSHAAW
jgi:glycosyltransferase involved in cell wall biosynthesis